MLIHLHSILGDWIDSGYFTEMTDYVMSDDCAIDKILDEFRDKEDKRVADDSAAETEQSTGRYSVPLASFFGGTGAVGLAKLPKNYRMRMYDMCFRLVARVLYLEDSMKLNSHKRFRNCLNDDRQQLLLQREAPSMIPTTEAELAQWSDFPSVRRNVLKTTAESGLRRGPVKTYGPCSLTIFSKWAQWRPAFTHKLFSFLFGR